MDIKKIITLACSSAEKAGLKAKELRDSVGFNVNTKSDKSLVSSGDLASEEIIKASILSQYPDHIILSEESVQDWNPKDYNNDNLWIVDPIDGTTNYVYGQPHCAVSIAFASKGQVLAAAVYNIFNAELYHAAKGQGAFLNGITIKTNNVTKLSDALVATGLPYKRPVLKHTENQILQVCNKCRDLRRIGAASLDLCYVASGRLDAYFETVQSWDMAAGALIVKEAGGVVINLQSSSDNIPADLNGDSLLASCKPLDSMLAELLVKA